MPSTYSTNLRLELIATGEQSGAWGNTTNYNLGSLLEQAITGVGSITMPNSNLTLSASSGVVDQSRNAVLVFTTGGGVPLTANRDVIIPSTPKLYILNNLTTGGYALTIKTSAGSGVAVANGYAALVYCDGTNVKLVCPEFNTVTGDSAVPGSIVVNTDAIIGENVTVGSRAIFTGSISGTTMTVTAVASGGLYIGQTVAGTGVASSTTITATGTGTGGTGTYTVSQSQTVTSTAMIATIGNLSVAGTMTNNGYTGGLTPPGSLMPYAGGGAVAAFSGSIIGNTLTVSSVASGTLAIGQLIGGTNTAGFTASIAGNIMTVTAVSSGSLAVGQTVGGTYTTSFTGRISGTTMVVSTIASGVLSVGQTVNGTGVGSSTTITATSNSSFTGSITGTTLTVTAVASGIVAIGQVVTGTGVAASTTITALGSGTGGTGTYTVSPTQPTAVASTALVGTTTLGSAGTYTVSQSQIVASNAMTATTVVASPTTITAFSTGSGGTGTYTISSSQTVPSTAMTSSMSVVQDTYITALGSGTGGTGTYTVGVNQTIPSTSMLSTPATLTGWLLAYGQAVSRSTYSNLYTAIGTVYGVGDGSTTFNVPDLRGRVPFGKDDMGGAPVNRITNAVSGLVATTLGATGGNQNVQSHAHTATDPGHTHGVNDLGHDHTTTVNDIGHYHQQGTEGIWLTNNAPLYGTAGASFTGNRSWGAAQNNQAWIAAPTSTNGTGINVVVNSRVTGITNVANATGFTVNTYGTGASANIPPAIILNYIIKT